MLLPVLALEMGQQIYEHPCSTSIPAQQRQQQEDDRHPHIPHLKHHPIVLHRRAHQNPHGNDTSQRLTHPPPGPSLPDPQKRGEA